MRLTAAEARPFDPSFRSVAHSVIRESSGNDEVVSTLDNLIESYGDHMTPYAVKVPRKLLQVAGHLPRSTAIRSAAHHATPLADGCSDVPGPQVIDALAAQFLKLLNEQACCWPIECGARRGAIRVEGGRGGMRLLHEHASAFEATGLCAPLKFCTPRSPFPTTIVTTQPIELALAAR